jgi:hypothetical protein
VHRQARLNVHTSLGMFTVTQCGHRNWARATFADRSVLPTASNTAKRPPRYLFTHYLHMSLFGTDNRDPSSAGSRRHGAVGA